MLGVAACCCVLLRVAACCCVLLRVAACCCVMSGILTSDYMFVLSYIWLCNSNCLCICMCYVVSACCVCVLRLCAASACCVLRVARPRNACVMYMRRRRWIERREVVNGLVMHTNKTEQDRRRGLSNFVVNLLGRYCLLYYPSLSSLC